MNKALGSFVVQAMKSTIIIAFICYFCAELDAGCILSMCCAGQENSDEKPDALMIAWYREDLTRAKRLIENGTNLEYEDEKGYTPLSLASRNGNLAFMNLLILNNANINHQNISGKTPLMCAVIGKNLAAIRLLLFYGADSSIADNKLRTPLSYALLANLDTIADTLERANNKPIIRNISLDPEQEYEEDECPICLIKLDISSDYVVTPCGHRYHLGCIREMMIRGQTCSLCRQELL